nr:putative retrotransposon protein [Tanacetum cinerariifolium]GFB54017.1 putative retrotransposon protein [Tanacetum cinerariifolium]
HKKDDLEIDKPQSDIIPVRRSTRTRHAPDCMCLYIDAEDHEDLVELPLNGKTVGSKWLFKKKTDMDREIRAIRILIAIAAFYDYEIWQMDVKTAFLNGYLSEKVYMEQPEEAEYIAVFDASKEAIRVQKFISRLGVVPTIEEPISMYCNNTEAITIANKSGITKGARHLRTKVHYLREVIEYGDVKLEKFTQMTA